MIEASDAMRVVEAVSKELNGIANVKSNFRRLPDSFWGYFARGHDQKGAFAVVLTYSEKIEDVEELLRMYQHWVEKNKGVPHEEPDSQATVR